MPNLELQLQLERCPHCNIARPSLFGISVFETMAYDGYNPRSWKTYQCSRCGGVVLAAAPRGETYICEMYPSPIIVSDTIPSRAKEI